MTEQRTAVPPQATTLVRGEETGGRVALVALREAAGEEPPRHVHAREDEVLYVREGRLTVFVGEMAHDLGPGACLVLPRGIEHGYVVESGTAHILVTLAPAGMEGYFGEGDGGHGCPNMERLIATAARYGVTITGPPPGCAE